MHTLDAINFDPTVKLPKLDTKLNLPTATKHISFLDMLNRNDELYKNATEKAMQYAAGENIPVHDVMVSMQNAKLSFQFAVQVRNKLVESYQEITRMQI
ncbi:flagellar hook-basal body complex protein FliE [uncultured Acinetobacter sp.]|uniref:flagellar hook-basal body complex protein FliE n=1 Tax=uncultured Acinetobacter sp. TaxID=165433 RepID=UPI00374A3871